MGRIWPAQKCTGAGAAHQASWAGSMEQWPAGALGLGAECGPGTQEAGGLELGSSRSSIPPGSSEGVRGRGQRAGRARDEHEAVEAGAAGAGTWRDGEAGEDGGAGAVAAGDLLDAGDLGVACCGSGRGRAGASISQWAKIFVKPRAFFPLWHALIRAVFPFRAKDGLRHGPTDYGPRFCSPGSFGP